MFWFYSHPAVYVMVLPGMGIISDVLPVFSRKPLFGYKAFVFATAGIGALGFSVWAHHMFATGQVLLPFFSIMTFLIAVPTGVKFFNWIATLFKGEISFPTAMLFAVGFLTMFLIGGIDGVFLASPPVDFALTETYWVVSHIHYVLFGGSVFAVYGFYYWFPKFSGKKLNEGLGKLHFWLQFIGFNLTFFSMHILGLLGMPRRIQDYAPLPDWSAQPAPDRRGPDHRPVDGAVPGQRGHDHAPQGQGPRGSLGRQHLGVVHHPPRRRTTSTACPRSTPSGRCSTCATPTSSPSIPTPPPQEPADGRRRRPLQERPAEDHHKPGGISSSLLGMVLFIASEVMFFGGLFGAYFTIRSAAPSGRRHPHLSAAYAAILTAILVTSSVTMQFGVWAIRKNEQRRLLLWLGVSLILGLIFLSMQALEYANLIEEGMTLSSGVFGSTFYTLTGFHGARGRRGRVHPHLLLRARSGSSPPATTTPSRWPPTTGTSSTWSGSACSAPSTCSQ